MHVVGLVSYVHSPEALEGRKEQKPEKKPVILGFLTILKNCQASSTFEPMNSAHLSMCQKDVKPTVYDITYTTLVTSQPL